jgi:XTP/dITP diphosphohydrolase
MLKLLLATTNQGKIREIKEVLKDIPLEIITLNDLNINIGVEENGKTFEENAIIKTKIIGKRTGYITLGEDSGLEVDALNGRPGIYSARYCEGTDKDRNDKLLRELKGTAKDKRTARYRAVVAVYDPNKKTINTFEGMSEGFIIEKPIGTNGFGYDPIFYNLDLKKTNAEISLSEKNKVSHRGRALEKCKEYLKSLS